ncbi:MAG: 2-oxo-4-hydroxy-4-carboxy-5-ureidoimidazoline decarboxylase [Luteitalea sp.]|nr:2-oxo-4-hydroxy-4-carboxy-5-ureidoimidazoline decarboxylase [Luteitalea sp.]
MTLTDLNLLSPANAEAELQQCCGSRRWTRLMLGERPFANPGVLIAEAERIWWSLSAADWLEAFAAHPRIGEPSESAWASQEQAGAASATEEVRGRLARGNREYEQRFGYTFLVCATGRTAEEMLSLLEERLRNAPHDELQVAALEQRKVTELRLLKLVSG